MKINIQNIIPILWSIILVPSLYVISTTNALYNHFNIQGLWQVKAPFYLAHTILFKILVLVLIVSTILKFLNKDIPILINKISVSSIIGVLIVIVLGFFPCLYQKVSPYTLENVLTQSFLCPSYSHRSTIAQIIFLIPSVLLYFISKSKLPNKALKKNK